MRSDKSLKYECTSTVVDDSPHAKYHEVRANDGWKPSGLEGQFIA